jgi:hypothetical protein
MPRYRTTTFRRIERLIMSKHDLWCTNYKIVLSPTTIDYYGPWYTDLWSATKCFISCCSASSPDWTSCRECLRAPGRYHFLLQQTPSARGISERFPAARAEVTGLERLHHEVAWLTSCREGLGTPTSCVSTSGSVGPNRSAIEGSKSCGQCFWEKYGVCWGG